MSPAELATADEAAAARQRAARMLAAPRLDPELDRLIACFHRDQAIVAAAPRLAELQAKFAAPVTLAQALAAALDALGPFGESALDPGGSLLPSDEAEAEDHRLADLPGLRRQLPALIRLATRRSGRLRQAVPSISNGGRRRADMLRSPRWAMAWGAAEVWARSGQLVGKGASTRFFAFAAELFLAAGELPPERTIIEAAQRFREWQARSAVVTERTQAGPVLSLPS